MTTRVASRCVSTIHPQFLMKTSLPRARIIVHRKYNVWFRTCQLNEFSKQGIHSQKKTRGYVDGMTRTPGQFTFSVMALRWEPAMDKIPSWWRSAVRLYTPSQRLPRSMPLQNPLHGSPQLCVYALAHLLPHMCVLHELSLNDWRSNATDVVLVCFCVAICLV